MIVSSYRDLHNSSLSAVSVLKMLNADQPELAYLCRGIAKLRNEPIPKRRPPTIGYMSPMKFEGQPVSLTFAGARLPMAASLGLTILYKAP